MTNTAEMFWARLDRSDPARCWEWHGSGLRTGYGRVSFGGRLWLTHRLAYELANEPIPDGLHVLHRCDNRRCCNPAHLFLGTHADNVADMVAKGRQARKLTDDDVISIRSRYRERGRGGMTLRALAEEYGVNPITIRNVVHGTIFQNVRESA